MIEEILTTKNIIIYILAINLITFIAMWLDKRKAKKGKWRIKEGTLMLLAIAGGTIGEIIGMYTFRHKTKKMKFSLGLPVILITQVFVIIYILNLLKSGKLII